MKLSIIIPVYHTQDTLPRCLDSILRQSFTDYEVILVDDGSTDDSPKICDAYSRQDGRVKVIHKENGGLSDARNAGILQAKGEYITFIDSDDTIAEDTLSLVIEKIITYPETDKQAFGGLIVSDALYFTIIQIVCLTECLYTLVVLVVYIEVVRGLNKEEVSCLFYLLYIMIGQVSFPIADGSKCWDSCDLKHQKRKENQYFFIHISKCI
jgi:glycosyltransferase involved in cell wall biosynthesis